MSNPEITERDDVPQTAGLFERWLALEKTAGKSPGQILADINAACGTKYKHAWLSLTASRPSQNLPLDVRRYMMATVLPVVVKEQGINAKIPDIEAMTKALT